MNYVKRTENQEIYIDLCSLSNLNNLKNNLSIDIDRLKAYSALFSSIENIL